MAHSLETGVCHLSEKKCFKCLEVKPIENFYKHRKMADGHLNKCKECTKSDVKKNRDDRVDYYRDYDSMRYANDPKVKERHLRYQRTRGFRISKRKADHKYETEYPERREARQILGRAVRDGKILKPKECSRCSSIPGSRKIHAHHHDYGKPLDVEWICAQCHADEHEIQRKPDISQFSQKQLDKWGIKGD